jgi:hypothetical protein
MADPTRVLTAGGVNMPSRSTAAGALLVLGLCAAARAGDEPSIGDQVVAYCQKHRGEMVGGGECFDLAAEALRAAGAKERGPDDPNEGDYAWGKLVCSLERAGRNLKPTGKREDIRPGDVIQFRDAKFEHRTPQFRSSLSFSHHTAVVARVENKGATVTILQQNYAGKKIVVEGTLRPDELTEGWIRIYRPLPADAGK